jgi:hypothetical protein
MRYHAACCAAGLWPNLCPHQNRSFGDVGPMSGLPESVHLATVVNERVVDLQRQSHLRIDF